METDLDSLFGGVYYQVTPKVEFSLTIYGNPATIMRPGRISVPWPFTSTRSNDASGCIRNQKKPGILFPRCRASILATSYSRTTFRRTTIGAAAFHFRVRNGNGWGHCAMITREEG